MGILEEIEGMDIPEEQKQKLRDAHAEEMRPQRVAGYRTGADEFVAKLSDAGLKEAPGFLKEVRRVLMSEDAHEPAAILMSDADLNLTGDDATGATTREEVTLAGEVKRLFSLLPGFNDGELKMQFSQQGNIAEAGTAPAHGDGPEGSADVATARQNIRRVTGQDGDAPKNTRKRYRRGGHTVVTGGDS